MLPKFQTPFRGLLLVGFNISSAKVQVSDGLCKKNGQGFVVLNLN